MRTALDMAKRLKQPSLRKIADQVAILNIVPVPKPVSLLQIMALFAKVARPEEPAHLTNRFIYPTYSPTLSPINSDVSWTDPGAKTFRYATQYRCRISVLYDGGSARLEDKDSWTTDKEMVFQDQLNFDTEYKASIMAHNEWGASEWSWLKFTTYSNPQGSPRPGPSPPPPPYITAARDASSQGIRVLGYHFTNGVQVRLDVTYPPGSVAKSYWSDPVVGGEFSTAISEVTCTGNSGEDCTVQATMDGRTFYSAQPVKC